MEAVFGCSSPSDCQEDGVHSVASTKKSDIFLSNSAEAKRKLQVGCSYSPYDHMQELQRSGAKVSGSHVLCRCCKITVLKENNLRCPTCDSTISSNQSWLLAALAGGFHKMRGEKSHIISRTSDSKMMAEDWINNCIGTMLTMLSRGVNISYGTNNDGTKVTTDYMESIANLDQEDIRLLMPDDRGLHNFCGESCVAMDVFDEQHLLRQSSDKIFIISDINESRMSGDEGSDLQLNPSESDLNILK